jgi:hypothetical protein
MIRPLTINQEQRSTLQTREVAASRSVSYNAIVVYIYIATNSIPRF